MSKKAYSSHEIIKILKDAGFELDRIKGSHHIFIHPQNKKRAVVPHLNNPDHTEPPIRSKVSHQSAQTEPPEKGGQNGGFRAK